MPRNDTEHSASELTYFALIAVIACASLGWLVAGGFTWTWLVPFFLMANRFDYAMRFHVKNWSVDCSAEEPLILCAALLLSPAQAGALFSSVLVLALLLDTRSWAGMILRSANVLCSVLACTSIWAVHRFAPLDGAVEVIVSMLVGMLAINVGVLILFADLIHTQGWRGYGAFLRERLLTYDMMVGNLGHISSAFAAVLAASVTPWALLTLFVPYLVVLRAARTAENLAVAEAKIGTDPLTGLTNRERLTAHLEQEMAAAERYGHRVAIVMGDLDNFKRVNDQLGHLAGDEVLLKTAEIMKAMMQRDPRLLAARYGGEEFVLVATTVSMETVRTLAEELRRRIDDELNAEFATSISLGCTQWLQGEDATAWIDRADKALYSAKLAGKNRVHEWLDGANEATPVPHLRAA